MDIAILNLEAQLAPSTGSISIQSRDQRLDAWHLGNSPTATGKSGSANQLPTFLLLPESIGRRSQPQLQLWRFFLSPLHWRLSSSSTSSLTRAFKASASSHSTGS